MAQQTPLPLPSKQKSHVFTILKLFDIIIVNKYYNLLTERTKLRTLNG